MKLDIRHPVTFTEKNSPYRSWNFRYPHEVVHDKTLGFEEKCSVLSAWASDLHAVKSFPALRHLPGTPEPVTFSSIMNARLQLDRLRSFGNDNDPTPPMPARHKPVNYQMVA